MFEGKVYYPKSYEHLGYLIAGIGIVILPMTCLVMLIRGTDRDGFILIILCIALIIVGTTLAIGYARFKIEVKEDGLILTPMFGKTRKVTYEQITSTRYSGPAKVLVLMEGERRLASVENYAIGYRDLCELCRMRGKMESY